MGKRTDKRSLKKEYGITIDEMVMEFAATNERLERLEDQYIRAIERIKKLEGKVL